jgi:5-methylcytosine-specific restriction endonuclease McrA
MHTSNSLNAAATLSDAELMTTVKQLAANERGATVQLVAHLAEVDARRLYLGEGCSSLFTYCTQALHLSEHAAYRRIEAARAARRFPGILEALAGGALHLTAVSLIAPHLTSDNVDSVIAASTHKTKRDVEELIATVRPAPPVPSSVRKVPEVPRSNADLRVSGGANGVPRAPDLVLGPSDAGEVQAPVQPVPRAIVRPLAPEHYLVKFTASRVMHQKLREAQALLRHQVPSGDLAEIFDRALTLLLAELRKTRHAATVRPRARQHSSSTGRYVAAAVKREVWERDGGQCAFVGTAGRCTERGFLEYHHMIPFADGGETDVSNLQLRCRAHNRLEAERWSGPDEEDLLREVSPIYESGDRRSATDSVRLGPGPSWSHSITKSESRAGFPVAVRVGGRSGDEPMDLTLASSRLAFGSADAPGEPRENRKHQNQPVDGMAPEADSRQPEQYPENQKHRPRKCAGPHRSPLRRTAASSGRDF